MSRPLSYNVYAKEAGEFGLIQLESGLELPKTQVYFFQNYVQKYKFKTDFYLKRMTFFWVIQTRTLRAHSKNCQN